MELVELLDGLSEDSPKHCQTCIHLGTHDRCDGCLGECAIWTYVVSGRIDHEFIRYDYKHWEGGNWLRAMQAQEREGKRNIIIGGQGEAEVNVKRTPAEVAKHLHRIAHECGYCIDRLVTRKFKGKEIKTLNAHVCAGSFMLVWYDGEFSHINKIGGGYWGRGTSYKRLSWPEFMESEEERQRIGELDRRIFNGEVEPCSTH